MQSLRSEPIWLPTEIVVKINLTNTATTGENHVLLFPDNLDGAMMRPRNRWEYELPEQAGPRQGRRSLRRMAIISASETGGWI
jgi:hypothetical protein